MAALAAALMNGSDPSPDLPQAAATPACAPTAEPVGRFGGPYSAVATAPGRVIAGVGSVLLVMTAAESEEPRVVGRSDPLPGKVRDIVVVAGLAYVAADTGWGVIDVGDPQRLRRVAWVPGDRFGGVHSIAVDRGRAYVASFDDIGIYDTADPSAPAPVGTIQVQNVTDFQVADDHLFFVDNDDRYGFAVVDVSSAAEPDVTAELLEANGSAVAFSGGFAYVNNEPGIAVVDVRDPKQPRVVNRIRLSSGASGVSAIVAAGDLLIVAGFTGLTLVDITDPLAPDLLFDSDPRYGAFVGGDALRLAAADRRAYLAGGDGLEAIRLGDGTAPESMWRLVTPGSASDVVVDGGTVYVADEGGNVYAVDTTAGVYPTVDRVLQREARHTLRSAPRVVLSGDRLYLASAAVSEVPGDQWRGGVSVFNTVDSQQLELAGVVDLGAAKPKAMELYGDILLVTSQDWPAGDSRLQLFDVMDAEGPSLLAGVGVEHVALDVAVAGHYAILAEGVLLGDSDGALHMIDVSNPTEPEVVASVSMDAQAVAVANNVAYVLERDALRLIDVGNPNEPTEITHTISIQAPTTVAAEDHYGVIGTRSGEIVVIDMTVPTAPVEAARRHHGAAVDRIELQGGKAYVSLGDLGVEILRVGQCMGAHLPSAVNG